MESEPARPNLYSGHGTNRHFYLPRLAKEFYQGNAVIHWTMPISQRSTGWLNDTFHFQFREIMLHAASREKLLCPAYCLMPDHIHLLWMGLHRNSNQRNGIKFLREHLGKCLRPQKFQAQAHDHVLREEERKRDALSKICFYILANPVRAKLGTEEQRWPYCGAIVPGYPTLHPLNENFWPLFWKIFEQSYQMEAGQWKLPP